MYPEGALALATGVLSEKLGKHFPGRPDVLVWLKEARFGESCTEWHRVQLGVENRITRVVLQPLSPKGWAHVDEWGNQYGYESIGEAYYWLPELSDLLGTEGLLAVVGVHDWVIHRADKYIEVEWIGSDRERCISGEVGWSDILTALLWIWGVMQGLDVISVIRPWWYELHYQEGVKGG